MQLDISNNLTIRDVKTQFHELFNYLKIEFFKGRHQKDLGSHRDMMFDNETVLKTMIKNGAEGHISFSGDISVKEFEQKFMSKFELNVQVFRKSGNVYLETTATDTWTLEQQNREGELASGRAPGPEAADTDRDIWE
jgi:hypothetical protein